MKNGWMLKVDTRVWHLWPIDHAETGDHAWCGQPKDDTCVSPGDPSVTAKCQTCLKNSATLPSPP